MSWHSMMRISLGSSEFRARFNDSASISTVRRKLAVRPLEWTPASVLELPVTRTCFLAIIFKALISSAWMVRISGVWNCQP